MATVSKTKLGKIACRDCGEKVYLLEHDSTKSLSYFCQECDVSWHAKKGTRSALDALKEVGKAPDLEPTTKLVPEPAPAPQPEPEPNKKSAGFWE